MHPEIENLINMALADGEVTEKERAIILRKAESLGEDKDEVEMILDGEIALLRKDQNSTQSNLSSKSNKEGNLKKCPSCGAPVKSFSNNCLDCGHEFRYNSLNNLSDNISKSNSRVVEISNTPIPINKEAIIEFLAFSIGNVNNKGLSYEERNAWRAKLEEAYNKANSIFSKEELVSLKKQYEKKIDDAITRLNLDDPSINEQWEKNKKNPLVYIGIIGGLGASFFLYYIIYKLIFG